MDLATIMGAEAEAAEVEEVLEGVVLDELPPHMKDRDLVYETGAWIRYSWDEALEDPETEERVEARFPGTEWRAFVREVFARLYGTTERLEQVPLGAEWAEPVHEAVEGVREWQELIDECRGDPTIAMLSALHVADEVDVPAPGPPVDPREAAAEAADASLPPEERQLAHEQMVADIQASQERAKEFRDTRTASATRRSARAAIKEALENAREYKAAAAMLSCGSGVSKEERVAWMHAVAENETVLKIARLAGRMEAVLEADKGSVKSDFGREDLVGVKLGGSIGEAVPMERALFVSGIPELELLQAAKLAEQRLLQNRQVGLVEEERAGKGPLVFACDESGSMSVSHGKYTGNEIAKAVMLTMMRQCAKEKRTFAVVHWSGTTKVTVWRNGESMNRSVLDEVTTFLNGGTDLAKAIRACTKIVSGEQVEFPKSEAERADVVLLTDACAYEHGSTERACSELDATGARLFTFHVTTDKTRHEVLSKHSQHYSHVAASSVDNGTTLALNIHSQLRKDTA